MPGVAAYYGPVGGARRRVRARFYLATVRRHTRAQALQNGAAAQHRWARPTAFAGRQHVQRLRPRVDVETVALSLVPAMPLAGTGTAGHGGGGAASLSRNADWTRRRVSARVVGA